MKSHRPLKFRLLGELALFGSDGRIVPLPPSRKTRALLGYLIATGASHRRERLCDLLWDGPGDPRAELRWSLSKIRPLLDGDSAVALMADREHVWIEPGVDLDLRSVRRLVGKDVGDAPTNALIEAAGMFGGEFLDGLDLPNCFRYQDWCMAEREAWSRLRLAIHAVLVERLDDRPADALAHACAIVAADPLSDAAHTAVVRLLARLGRHRDALAHYDHARRVLEAEVGEAPSAELQEARDALRVVTGVSQVEPAAVEDDAPAAMSRPMPSAGPIVGRVAERARIDRWVGTAAAERGVLLLTGEPGIGKSRLLAHAGERIAAGGRQAIGARAYEAELTRPYGIWIDALRAMLRGRTADSLPRDLGLLLPEAGAVIDDQGNRARLFDAVLAFLHRETLAQPAGLLLDDIQWIDEASASLLHYVARHSDAGLFLACAARSGEIDDNVAAARALRSLDQDGRLQSIELAALDLAETAQLVRQVDETLDGARIHGESGGNPLFALALTRADGTAESDRGRRVESLVAGQIGRLSDDAREVLEWAAAQGRAFSAADLARARRRDASALVAALGALERRGLIRPLDEDSYDFTHDLVRQATYRAISQPRRKIIHRHIARALGAVGDRDATRAADIAHHAALADDDATAVQACARAGARALRLFANAEAAGFAERGLRHADRMLEGATAVEARIALLRLRVLAASGPGMRPLPPLSDSVAAATEAAERLGLQGAAATGHHLMSVLHQEAGEMRQAKISTLRAAEAGRAADETTRTHQLANTARCLLELESEVDRARGLIAEAGAIAGARRLELCELDWARGLLQRWDGHRETAVGSITRALALARADQDRWREYKCLIWLAILAEERDRHDEMDVRCAELQAVALRLGENETPFVETMRALAGLATGGADADGMLAHALSALRVVDDKSYLAHALNRAAQLHWQAGRVDQARDCAGEALALASVMGRGNQIALARAMVDSASPPAPTPVPTRRGQGRRAKSSRR